MNGDVKAAIRQRAAELHFDFCQFTTAAPPDSAVQFREWLVAGFHGEMAYLARQADKRENLQLVLPGVRSVICLAVSYHLNSASSPTSAVARYARFSDYHTLLREPLRALTAFVDQVGGGTTQSLWYVDTGPVLERDLAQRAGIGFIGKHANLVSRSLGNWFLLAEILTPLELAPDDPEPNRCGACTRCLVACPTQAILAPFRLDARRCLSYLTIELRGSIPVELRPAIGARIFGCDDCLAVCPWNRFAREGRFMKAHARPELLQPDLLELLALDESGFRQRFAGTPILRAKRRGLLRNVCVALGNTADASVRPALERAAADADPLIAEHARWARDRIAARNERLFTEFRGRGPRPGGAEGE
jgi:epoxyqueuosine reductase